MNVITIEDYKSTYWPKLDGAIDQLLTQSPGDYIPISYEQIYSCVYKCVCQQHSEQMYSDLIKKITSHLERVSKELQASPPDLYIERFNIALGQYMGALQSIVPLFIYMNKFYIETKLNRDLKDDLIKLFTEHVAEKHIYSLMPLLLEAQSTPFQVTPSTMANIVKGLYTLRPEWVQMAPTLFSKFIPNILPPAVESELSEYAAQDQKLQRELIQNGFTRQVFFPFVTRYVHFLRRVWLGRGGLQGSEISVQLCENQRSRAQVGSSLSGELLKLGLILWKLLFAKWILKKGFLVGWAVRLGTLQSSSSFRPLIFGLNTWKNNVEIL
uniref:CDK2-associated and cullin domain-containing protein 1 n=1 Tax=Equus asinus TaxID=9793 RepID=A0A9L0JYE5_EQUAS